MRYFWLRQSHAEQDYIGRRPLTALRVDWQKDSPIFCLDEPAQTKHALPFLPFIERPCFIVSQTFRALLEADSVGFNLPGFRFRKCVLGIRGQLPQPLYYFIKVPVLDCLSPQSTFTPDGQAKEIVLDRRKIEFSNAFSLILNQSPRLIVTLDLLEALLRHGQLPLTYTEIAVE